MPACALAHGERALYPCDSPTLGHRLSGRCARVAFDVSQSHGWKAAYPLPFNVFIQGKGPSMPGAPTSSHDPYQTPTHQATPMETIQG